MAAQYRHICPSGLCEKGGSLETVETASQTVYLWVAHVASVEGGAQGPLWRKFVFRFHRKLQGKPAISDDSSTIYKKESQQAGRQIIEKHDENVD